MMPIYDCKKDAERYRWLRKNFDVLEFQQKSNDKCLRIKNGSRPDLLDDVIDELRALTVPNAKVSEGENER